MLIDLKNIVYHKCKEIEKKKKKQTLRESLATIECICFSNLFN